MYFQEPQQQQNIRTGGAALLAASGLFAPSRERAFVLLMFLRTPIITCHACWLSGTGFPLALPNATV